MVTRNLPCIFYPTSVVLVDDNKTFLDNLSLKLSEFSPCFTFTNPNEAIKHLQSPSNQNKILKGISATDLTSDLHMPSSGTVPIQFDVSNLYKNVYDSNSFSEVSVVVVDYTMPAINGAEFCRALTDIPAKKILVTGEPDEKLAVQLFDEGIIDKFILKGQPGFANEVKNCVLKMQSKYFQDLTAPIVQQLKVEEDSALGDPVFMNLFDSVRDEIKPESFYLTDTNGSFLFVGSDNKPTWLIIKTKTTLEEYAQQFEDADLPPESVESVRQGDVSIYLPSFDYFIESFKFDIREHFYPAKKLHGDKDYCYFVTKSLPGFPLDESKIVSVQDYIDK
jgi:CheY-like chemotaxis protein